ncbi:hypothetical protein HGRIS_002655 [Hohenbuehelia grisea]|uniref:Uncharacterized protein n=1 Tax=Hohenbuehelia grisea TaxID=104357 RepID=A0ABR3JLN4_9AGAR
MHPHHARPRVYRSKTDPAGSSRTHRDSKGGAHKHDEGGVPGPWQHMAETFTWVTEQELDKHGLNQSGKWVLVDQIFVAPELPHTQSGTPRTHAQPRARSAKPLRPERSEGHEKPQAERWEELLYAYELEAERWMRHEEEARRLAAEREKEHARFLREESRRFEAARARQRQREVEWRRLAELERARMFATMYGHERRERAKADKAMEDAWRRYEDAWNAMPSSAESLTFASIPWPVVSVPTKPADLTSAATVMFLFSSLHSKGQSRKERIRSAQLRWHPDRFRRLMNRVKEEDKTAVEEGVGIVARCLNDLMAREAVASRHQTTTVT